MGLEDSTRARLRERVLAWSLLPPTAAEEHEFRRSFVALLGVVGAPEDVATVLSWIEADDQHRLRVETETGKRYIYDDRAWYAGALARLGAYDALCKLVQRPDYVGAASQGLAELGSRLSPNQIAAACAAIRQVLRQAIDTPTPSRPPFWHDIGEAVVSLGKLGDMKAAPLLSRLQPLKAFKWAIVNALERLTRRGWTVPSGELSNRVLEISNHAHPDSQEAFLAVRCVALLMLSDKPQVGVDQARSLWLKGALYEGDTVIIRALGRSRGTSAVQLLADFLAKGDVRRHRYSDVLSALAEHRSVEARDVVLAELDRLESSPPPSPLGTADAVAKALREFATALPDTIDVLRARAPALRAAASREVVTAVIASLANGAPTGRATVLDVLPTIRDDARPPVTFDAGEAIQVAFLERRPTGSPNTYTPTPRSANALRRELFAMYRDPVRSRSARRLLTEIENLRIEYGRPADEAHHPDIARRDANVISWLSEPTPPSTATLPVRGPSTPRESSLP
jgi:hypothetical protein